MKRDVSVTKLLEYAPEIVWECLTNQEILSRWTGMQNFKLEIGHEFIAKSKPIKSQGFDGIMYHKILYFNPVKQLTYTFQGGPGEGVITLDTVVTWTLTPKNGGTELEIKQTGFEGLKNYFTSFIMELGWKKQVLRKLEAVLEQLKK